MAKIISLFNNKGGVSKTTTTFHLGWKLAEKGYRVLIVDTDPQCNLTGLCLSTSKHNRLEDFYANNSYNIVSALSPVFNGDPVPLKATECYSFEKNPKLFLLPGHIDFSKYDASYTISENLGDALSALKNVPGAFRTLLLKTAEDKNLDYILVDMSPNISSTNANILMSGDYFIIPCAPDYFCYMAVQSLMEVFPRWNEIYTKMRSNPVFQKAIYKINDHAPKFIGTIQQRYRPRNGAPSKAFKEWNDDIDLLVKNQLVPILESQNMTVPYDQLNYDEMYNLINIADFNSLIAQSQEHNTPVFMLTQEQVNKQGKVWENMQENIMDFNKTFDVLANRVIAATRE